MLHEIPFDYDSWVTILLHDNLENYRRNDYDFSKYTYLDNKFIWIGNRLMDVNKISIKVMYSSVYK